MTKRCIFCMGELQENQNVCPRCQHSQKWTAALYHLPPGTVLAGRFRLGIVTSEDPFILNYIAYDEKEQTVCWILEFYPKAFAQRLIMDSSNIEPKSGYEAIYKKLGQNFIRSFQTAYGISQITQLEKAVTIIDANQSAYIVLKPSATKSLTSILNKKKKYTVSQLNDLFRPLFKDLYLIHKKNIIHSRINPDRIYIDENGAYLRGLGVLMDASLLKYGQDSFLKAGYGAWEQYDETQQLTKAADIYALSAVYYYALSLHPVPDVRKRMEKEDLPDLNEIEPAVSEKTAAVIKKGLALDPKDRYQSIDLFFQDLLDSQKTQTDGLENTISQKPAVKRRKKSRKVQARKRRRTFKASFAAGISLIALGTALASGTWWYDQEHMTSQSSTPGVFSEGYLKAESIEKLQNVDVDTLVLDGCDFEEFKSSQLTSNPIITKIEISNPKNLKSLTFLNIFENVRELDLHNCSLSDKTLKGVNFSSFKRLEKLNISNNSLSDISFLAQTSSLQKLDASNNQITAMDSLKDLPNLIWADLSQNNITRFTPLHSANEVKLNAAYNSITDLEAPKENGAYYNLLSLVNNPIFSGDAQKYAALSELKGNSLYISYDFKEEHLDDAQTEMAAYTLAFNQFENTYLLNTDNTGKEWIQSYFAGKPYIFIDDAAYKQAMQINMEVE